MKHLKGMSVFARIVEEGSISRAADSLGVSKSVISQQLKMLENEIGVTLLKRTTRKQSLTPTGEGFYQYCQKLNLLAEEALIGAKDFLCEPQGRVRITASNALMETFVAPAIANVLTAFPKVKPELISSDEHMNLAEENIDLAIRVGSSRDSALKQQRIGQFRDVLCGHKRLISTGVNEATPYIANSWQGLKIYHQFKSRKGSEEFIFETEASCYSNSYHACFSMLQKRAGIGLVPDFLLHDTSHELEPVFPEHQLSVNQIYAIHPYIQHLPLTVKLCLDEICACLDTVLNC